ncbi:DUF4292 domain-containing protein [Lewinella sp. IMCC34183]|uniref:DUF4292 domain-containing protein n=1 Tax=Lewinella sp. IMCC34183 TaxID=2248762 RepID=UPI000E27FC0D|nr:DUF4292 domain-containing protein [Lewinella sp. IMCC34183]
MRLYLLALVAVLTLSYCTRKTGGPTAGDGTAVTTNKLRLPQVLRSIDDNRAAPEWMNAKARVDLKSEKLSIGGTAYIRVHRDEAIWMSVKKFGIEGARALIRPDSFFLFNRLEGEYIAEPLSYVEEKYKIPARFELLQEIFFGNAVFLTDDLELGRAEGSIQLTGRSPDFAVDYRYDPATFQLSSMELEELGQSRTLNVSNADYGSVEGLPVAFAKRRRVLVDGASEGAGQMDLEFTDLRFEGPVDMPFSFR